LYHIKTALPLPTGINNSYSKNGLFAESTPDKKKLQSGFNQETFLIDPYDTVGCAPLKVRFHLNQLPVILADGHL